jgi:hypothetical protein
MVPAPKASDASPAAGPLLTLDERVRFERDGFLPLGPLLTPDEAARLAARADELATGVRRLDGVQVQRDTGGAYDELPAAEDQPADGGLAYRKVQGLEHDDLFAPLLRHPRVVAACALLYGPHAPVALFRAMVMNKPAGQGTELPWHQDGGAVWALDRDPLVTVWVALDPATEANGCMEVVPGSHRLGLLSWEGSTVSEEHAAEHCPPEARRSLPVPAGHGVLLHNWLLHRSGVNPSAQPRRAFTCCLVDGRTRNELTGAHLPLVWGQLPPEAPHLVEQARVRDHLEATAAEAVRYARSLEAERARLEAELAEATAPGWRRALARTRRGGSG